MQTPKVKITAKKKNIEWRINEICKIQGLFCTSTISLILENDEVGGIDCLIKYKNGEMDCNWGQMRTYTFFQVTN